jgi:uncharacterized membrane protein HdeD (DUF308 family)
MKKDCPYIRQLQYHARWEFFIGILLISAGLFMYFDPKHLLYHQTLILIIMIGLGLFCIICAVLSFIRINNSCK